MRMHRVPKSRYNIKSLVMGHGSASRSSRRTYGQKRGNWRWISSVRALDRLRAIAPTGVRRRHSGKERKGRAAVARPFERQSSDRPGFARLGQLIDDFHHIGPDRPLYRHALNAWASPLATCALPKGVCYLLTYLSVASTARCSARRSMASAARRSAPRSMAQGLAPRSKARRSGHCSTLDGSMLGSALDSLCASTLSSARNGVGGSTFGFALDGNGSTLCSLLDGFNGSTYSLALEASAAQRSARRSIIYATRRSIVLSTAQCPSRRTWATH